MTRPTITPNFEREESYWAHGHRVIVGLDEVGRGALAGPAVVGAVTFPYQFSAQPAVHSVTGVRDSKTLNPYARSIASRKIKRHAFHWAVGVASAEIVDRIGIVPAIRLAALSALAYIGIGEALVLYDRSLVSKPFNEYRSYEIHRGDDSCFSIAAASIVAKVWRDEYMRRLSRDWRWRVYQWHQNVGYASLQHRHAILAYGATPHHRYSFIKNLI